MQRMFDGWDYQPNDRDFLQFRSGRQSQDFEKKFPFSIHRLHAKPYGKDPKKAKEWVTPGTAQSKNTPVTSRPEVQGSSIVTGLRTVTTSDPRRSDDQIRLAQVNNCFVNNH